MGGVVHQSKEISDCFSAEVWQNYAVHIWMPFQHIKEHFEDDSMDTTCQTIDIVYIHVKKSGCVLEIKNIQIT